MTTAPHTKDICVCIRKRNATHFAVYPVRDTFHKPEDFPEPVRLRFRWAKKCDSAREAKIEAEGLMAWLKVYGINSTILRVQEA